MEKVPALVARFSLACAEKLNQFLAALLGEKTMAAFMGKVWLSGLKVHDAGTMRTINISGRTGVEYEWFVERIEAARRAENPGTQAAIEFYEEISFLPVSADELTSAGISDGVIKIRLSPAVSGKLKQAGLAGSTTGWRVSVAGELVKD
ncbi:MAG: hypothetical protein ACR2OR_13775 [Hyphomicrobiales bacterium]